MTEHNQKIIWIAGGDGLVGRQLAEKTDKGKYDVYVLTRKPNRSEGNGIQFIHWNTEKQEIDSELIPDIIINLAGAGIADARWTNPRKDVLISSRVRSASTIETYLKKRNASPELYVSASAVGFYGDRGHANLNEESAPGSEFMSDCCQQWEDAAKRTGSQCQRTVILRIGIVLSMLGGALPKMLMTRNLFVYSYFGRGDQYYPWIHIDDLVNLILVCAEDQSYQGIYNAVAPQQITNRDMMSSIMKVCGLKGILMSAPAFALQLILGEMSRVVLNSNRIDAGRLTSAGFQWEFTEVGQAVKHLLDKQK